MWSSAAVIRAALAAGALAAASVAFGQNRLPEVDRFTAKTVAMTPEIELRIDVREWSDEDARSAVVAALADGSDVAGALRALPTVGYVWRSDSGVGYSLKYAHRIETPDGDRITFVTDKRLGAYDFKPWTADGVTESSELEYSVIELRLPENGTGDGTLSLAAEVKLDQENGLVLLEAPANAPRLLSGVQLEPKPYWAKGS